MTGLAKSVQDLEKAGHLKRIEASIDPNLEIAEIQRRAYAQKAPALLFENVIGTRFSCVTNMFGTVERARYLFRDTFELVQMAVRLKADPVDFARYLVKNAHKQPINCLKLPFAGISSLPKKINPKRSPTMQHSCNLTELPQIKCWPDDGGAFVTLPQVFSRDPDNRSIMQSNLGMYRIQQNGNQYEANKEVGLHYQIHRGLGIHHTNAARRKERLPVSIFVGGHPAHTLAAVMPLPEGLSELIFAGMLAGNRFRYSESGPQTIASDADFCITGSIDPTHTKPEGPFGDHLGYYSLTHDFPVMTVDKVYHRKDGIWPFTIVGRPPQEDTTFGAIIHELTEPMVPISLPGVAELHAVDAAGVHPLLLAKGSERYTPYQKTTKPQELLTQAHAILGFNQCSLAKYLIIVNGKSPDCPALHDIEEVLKFVFERIDFHRDLHFHTKTTMDTLDYSGTGLNSGSKLVIAASGKKKRHLATNIPKDLRLPDFFENPCIAMPGVLSIEARSFSDHKTAKHDMETLAQHFAQIEGVALVVVNDDSEFCAATLNNFLWVTFTRSNPSHDCYGVNEATLNKHWHCDPPLIIDARIKPHHAPPLVENPEITKRVDELCKQGGPLHGIIV